jgi:hypothetical protein
MELPAVNHLLFNQATYKKTRPNTCRHSLEHLPNHLLREYDDGI